MKAVLALFTAESYPTALSALEPLRAVAISGPTATEQITAEPTATWLPSPSLPSGRRRRSSRAIELGSPCKRAWAKLTVPSSTRLAPPSLGMAEAEVMAQPMLVAAGGPSALLDSLSDVLPPHLTLQRLTHPM